VVALVEEMLALHRQLAAARTTHEQENLKRQIDAIILPGITYTEQEPMKIKLAGIDLFSRESVNSRFIKGIRDFNA
jgi:hypothetical protein